MPKTAQGKENKLWEITVKVQNRPVGLMQLSAPTAELALADAEREIKCEVKLRH
jgi:hypothetical protein